MKADIQQAIEFIKAATGQDVTTNDIDGNYHGCISFKLDDAAWGGAYQQAKAAMGDPVSNISWSLATHTWQFNESRRMNLYATSSSMLVALHDTEAA
jgi:hypothetical protein